jgi:hypothetical protein
MGYFRLKPRRQAERAHKESLRLGQDPGVTMMTPGPTYKEWRNVRVAVPAWPWDAGQGQGVSARLASSAERACSRRRRSRS